MDKAADADLGPNHNAHVSGNRGIGPHNLIGSVVYVGSCQSKPGPACGCARIPPVANTADVMISARPTDNGHNAATLRSACASDVSAGVNSVETGQRRQKQRRALEHGTWRASNAPTMPALVLSLPLVESCSTVSSAHLALVYVSKKDG